METGESLYITGNYLRHGWTIIPHGVLWGTISHPCTVLPHGKWGQVIGLAQHTKWLRGFYKQKTMKSLTHVQCLVMTKRQRIGKICNDMTVSNTSSENKAHSIADNILCKSLRLSENSVDSRLAPSQWETSLQSNGVSHWLGANLESALWLVYGH